MSEAQELIARAIERGERRAAATPAVDYEALNKMVRRQKGALTRAINSGDAERVVRACHDAVREWSAPGAMWPDDWPRWQAALNDVLPFGRQVDLGDLV